MLRERKIISVLAVVILAGMVSGASAGDWETLAGNSARQSVLTGTPAVAHQEYWRIALDDAMSDTGWSAVGAGSPVIFGENVFVYAQKGSGFSPTDGAIIALDKHSGAFSWSADVGLPQMGSWSSPTVDTATGSIIVGSGANSVKCLDAATGALKWDTMLAKSVVNATAAAGGGKAYITDYDGFGTNGILYAVNNDPTDGVTDGTIDWQYTIGGASGSTPCYHDGVVYVASINDGSGGSGWPNSRGQVYALNASTGAKAWQTPLPDDSSAGNPFGGLSYYDGKLYIGTYEFYGDDESAGLYRLDAAGGNVECSTLSNRSSIIPLVWQQASGSKVVIHSGGIEGYGTHQEVQFFDEATGQLLGKTSIESDEGWIGNWTYEPAVIGDVLYVGGREAEFFGPSDHLWAIDLSAIDWDAAAINPFTLTPTDLAVLADLGPGSSPAYFSDGDYGFLVTYGPGGEVIVYGVPEPATVTLLVLGGLAMLKRKRKSRA